MITSWTYIELIQKALTRCPHQLCTYLFWLGLVLSAPPSSSHTHSLWKQSPVESPHLWCNLWLHWFLGIYCTRYDIGSLLLPSPIYPQSSWSLNRYSLSKWVLVQQSTRFFTHRPRASWPQQTMGAATQIILSGRISVGVSAYPSSRWPQYSRWACDWGPHIWTQA